MVALGQDMGTLAVSARPRSPVLPELVSAILTFPSLTHADGPLLGSGLFFVSGLDLRVI